MKLKKRSLRGVAAALFALTLALAPLQGLTMTVSAEGEETATVTPPEIVMFNAETILVDAADGQEYVIVPAGEEPDWTTPAPIDEESGCAVFENLTPATEYEIYTRVKATEDAPAGEAVTASHVTGLWGVFKSGEEYVGETLTIETYPEGIEGLTDQWYYQEVTEMEEGYTHSVRGAAIEGANSSTYTIAEADLGKYLCVAISKNGHELIDAEFGPVLDPATRVYYPEYPYVQSWSSTSLLVENVEGQEYTIVPAGEEPDWSAPAEAEEGYVEFEDLTPATAYEIYTRFTAPEGNQTEEAVSSYFVTSLEGLSLDGEPFVGETLTVIAYPEDAEGLEYQWYYQEILEEEEGFTHSVRGEAIEGADSSTYTIKKEDLGKTLCVVISMEGWELDETTIGPVLESAPEDPDEPENPDEPSDPDEPSNPDEPENPDEPSNPDVPISPATGGTGSSLLYVIMLISGIALLLLIFFARS